MMSTANRTPDEHSLRKTRAADAETKRLRSTATPHSGAFDSRSLRRSPENVMRLQRLAGNGAVNRALSPTIQRLKGAPGTAQAGSTVTYEFSDDFKKKHTADNAAGAKAATELRVKSGKPPAIAEGQIPNHVAKLADWTAVIDKHTAIVPPDGDWSPEEGDVEPSWVERLAQVTVTGWEPKKVGEKVTEPGPTTFKRYVGGKWKITGAEIDEEDGTTVTPGEAHMLIDHVTQ